MPRLLTPSILTLALLGGCATVPDTRPAPADAVPVANVRHVAAPQPAADWLPRAALPQDARTGDAGRALLLDVEIDRGTVRAVEPAAVDLARLRVRIESSSREASVLALENGTAQPLVLDLYVSPDGERFRRVPTCALQPGVPVYERLPEAVSHLAVAAVTTASGSDCR